MALIFICSTCEEKYDADYMLGDVTYFVDNQRFSIKSSEEPCDKCKVEIKKAEEETKKRIKASKHPEQDNLF